MHQVRVGEGLPVVAQLVDMRFEFAQERRVARPCAVAAWKA